MTRLLRSHPRGSKEAGFDVPADALARAAKFLLGLRARDGSFGYLPSSFDPHRPPGPEAAGRSPLCALALLGLGAGDVADVRAALGHLLAHRAAITGQRGKDLCHTGPQGQASYYFLFDYAFAAAAVRRLPADERRPLREALLGDVLGARLGDGGFMDMPGLGRAYGTGMALEALDALRAP